MIGGARAASTADLGAVAEFAAEAVEELTPHRGGALWRRTVARSAPFDDAVQRVFDDPNSTLVVGVIDDTPVGYGVLRVETLTDGGRLGHVDDLYTLPGARGVGVGEAMMNLLVDAARSAGCFGVDSLALPGDRHTKNFFESFGLKARLLVVHRSLDVT